VIRNVAGYLLLAAALVAAAADAAQRRKREKRPMSAKPKHYTIPIIDLANETHRQVIVDKEPGQYLGHPTTALLEDNKTMICVYPKGHGRGAIVMKKSIDSGLTWGQRLPVPQNWATSKEVPTIHRVIDPKGMKRLILFSGLYPIRMAVSEDDGATWTPLRPIGNFGGIVAMASVVRLKDGRYMAMFHDDGRFLKKGGRRTGRFRVYKTLSADGGLTWGEPEVVTEHPVAHLCEPGVVRSPDGKQLCALLRENSRRFNSFVIYSDDEGETWTEPVELPAALTGDRHVGRYAPDGRLFISFRDTTHVSPTKGDWVGWVGTYDDIVKGREGQYRVRLMDNHRGADCAYPAVELLPDGTFVTTTYGHWTKGQPPYIVSVRFKIEELDEKAKLLPQHADDGSARGHCAAYGGRRGGGVQHPRMASLLADGPLLPLPTCVGRHSRGRLRRLRCGFLCVSRAAPSGAAPPSLPGSAEGVLPVGDEEWPKCPSRIFRPVYPTPAALITSVAEDGTPNIITLGEVFNISISDPVVVGLAIMPSRYSYELIERSGEFTVNLPTAKMAEVVDRCGAVSGREVGDKFAHVGLTPVPAAKIRPPLIGECPINLECTLTDIVKSGDHDLFRGQVVAQHVDEAYLDERGNIAVERLDPLCYILGQYWSAGRRLGQHGFTKQR